MDNLRSINDSPSQLQPDQHLGIMATLPSDIVFEIFSYLDQQDCLICMAICRYWYNMVPEYAQEVWSAVRFSTLDVLFPNKRRIRCLGNHVKRVILDIENNEQVLYHTMRKLLVWGCTKIEELEFNGCATVDFDTFLGFLAKLSSHLTQLRLLDHNSNIAFSPLFNVCPELTHFAFNVSRSAWWKYEMYTKEAVVEEVERRLPADQMTKITHLFLNTDMDKDSRIYPILKCCPNLRSFVGPSTKTIELDYATQDWQYNDVAIDLRRLKEFCPKVNYVRSFYTYTNLDDVTDIDTFVNDPQCSGLRYLSVCEDYGPDQIAQCLASNQDTLEYLSIQSYDFYDETVFGHWWSPLYETFQLVHLTTFICNSGMSYDSQSLAYFIDLCPALETLVLGGHELTFDRITAQLLPTRHQLRSLDIDSLHVSDSYCFTIILNCFPALQELTLTFASVPIDVEKYFRHVTQLKHLTLAFIRWIYDDNDNHGTTNEVDETAVTFFFQYLATHAHLETVRLSEVPLFGTEALLKVGSIQTLKTCDITLQDTLHWDYALKNFASLLHGTVIETLKFRSVGFIPQDALVTLGELPLLKDLYVSSTSSHLSSCKVVGPGILQLLLKSRSITNIYFGNVVVTRSREDKTSYYDNLLTFIEQEIPWYYVEEINLRETYRPSRMYSMYYQTAIKRKSYP